MPKFAEGSKVIPCSFGWQCLGQESCLKPGQAGNTLVSATAALLKGDYTPCLVNTEIHSGEKGINP